MKSKLKIFTAFILMVITAITMCIPAFAATSSISSVSIKGSAKLEAGIYTSGLSVGIDDESCDINVSTSSPFYMITDCEITSADRILKIGDTVRLRVTLEAVDPDIRAFKGTYSSNNVSIASALGTFASAQRSGSEMLTVNISLKAATGQYECPYNVGWSHSSLGTATWKAPEVNSGYYDIVLYRDGKRVDLKLPDGNTYVPAYNGTSVNFYPYMTKAGEYSYQIRTVPAPSTSKTAGKVSEWEQSDTIYINASQVSNGQGQGQIISGNGPVMPVVINAGWIKDGNTWYYKYPSGAFKVNGWEKIGEHWYYFDGSGAMLTGWITWNGRMYYLRGTQGEGPEGSMATGWKKEGNVWFYLDSIPTSPTYGAALCDTWVVYNGQKYYLTPNGSMAEGWTQIGGQFYYFEPGEGHLYTNTWINTFYVDANGVWIQNV